MKTIMMTTTLRPTKISTICCIKNELYNTDEEEDEEEEEDGTGGHAIRYNDFFDGPPVSRRKQKVQLPGSSPADSGDEDVDWDEGADDYMDEDESDSGGGGAVVASTAHSKRSDKMNEQIVQLEQELVTAKSWDLKGEVQAGDRPENSLLGIVADIDRSSKPAPIITQQYTDSIEDMIKKRIKDDNFNDVMPRAATEDKRFGGDEEDFQLSQEKNKDGLADVSFFCYFEIIQIKKAENNLCFFQTLNMLSNYVKCSLYLISAAI